MAEIIARAETADGKRIVLWSDGQLTQILGIYIPGIGKPRNTELALRAAYMVLGDASLYTMSEIPRLYRAAKKAGNVGEMRSRFAASDLTDNHMQETR